MPVCCKVERMEEKAPRFANDLVKESPAYAN
jgi:hypothetical protein